MDETAANKLAIDLKTRLLYFAKKAQRKYDYYNADHDTEDFGISVPGKMVNNRPGIGWASRAVNVIGDRVVFDGFANDTFGINDLLDEINALPTLNKAKHDAFIGGCSFVAVSDGKNNKVLIPFTATEATGIVDNDTGMLKMGMAVTSWQKPAALKKDKNYTFEPKDFVIFTPDFTAIYKDRTITDIIKNPTGRTLLHPLTHRQSADRPLGKSRITNTARRIINEVGRMKRREEIAEEFYSIPQRYINGLAEGAKKDDSLDSVIGKVWAITKDSDGDKPEIGQLAQMSIDQFETAKKDKARDFCAETALTLRNLGYETSNPSSSESLMALSDDMLLEAQTAQTEMGEQIKQIAITLRMAIDQINVIPDNLKNIMPSWKPIFRVDIGAAGDAMYKLFQVMPELIGTTAGYQMLGIGVREAEALATKRNVSSFTPGGQNG